MANIILTEGDNVLDFQLTPLPPPVANLSGVVTEAGTNIPLSGVLVTINGLATTTDVNGFYSFIQLTPGPYTITFELAGYETQ